MDDMWTSKESNFTWILVQCHSLNYRMGMVDRCKDQSLEEAIVSEEPLWPNSMLYGTINKSMAKNVDAQNWNNGWTICGH